MAIFEKYHPLLSTHYTLDWLTTAKLKDVYALRSDATQAVLSGRERDAQIEDTARYVNHSMRLVMGNKALLYGIAKRDTNEFVGSICLWQFNAAQTQAMLRAEVLTGQDSAVILDEVLPRTIGFAFFELGLTQLRMLVPQTATDYLAILARHHFTQTVSTRTRTLPDGAKVPLVDARIDRDAVADDPQYHF